ncbi:MAG: glycine betaine ABC transporter substrate-binding protein [Spirochaetia bacterium]|nr:glycine betaine ABC transporter substrate-binding protein [Spirochaetia bacterium]MCF7952935.1 glycine betaine ABC transporter substrate-binding protein [Spirochaetales bacterium]
MKFFTKVFTIALILFIAGTMAFAQGQQGEAKKEADLVYVNWAEGVAYTHLAKVVLEEKLGYEVNITAADVAPAYTSIAQGDQDAFMETWLPVLHADYYEQYKDDIIDLGNVYEGTQSGLVVPSYVSIDKISELNDHADKFDGKITGIDAGAGVMKTTEEKVIPQYDLELDLMASSGPAMTAALKDAVDNEEWIVVTGWTPHWKFGRWDLKFLEQDADKQVWGEGNIHIMGRKNLETDKPELAQFLKNMFFTTDQLADLMLKVEQSDKDVLEVARDWMNENEDVVEAWLP